MNKEKMEKSVKRLVLNAKKNNDLDEAVKELRDIRKYIFGCNLFEFIDKDKFDELKVIVECAIADINELRFGEVDNYGN